MVTVAILISFPESLYVNSFIKEVGIDKYMGKSFGREEIVQHRQPITSFN